jgi:hypothetical protein
MVALDALRRLPASPQESDYRQGLLAWMSVLEQANGAYGYQSADHATLRNTYHMLDAFRSLQAELSEQRKNHVRRFVRRCRSGEGGFANLPGRTPTVVDTWYGVRLAVLVGPETAR